MGVVILFGLSALQRAVIVHCASGVLVSDTLHHLLSPVRVHCTLHHPASLPDLHLRTQQNIDFVTFVRSQGGIRVCCCEALSERLSGLGSRMSSR